MTNIFIEKRHVNFAKNYKFLALPINIQMKKDYLSVLKAKLKALSDSKHTYYTFSEGKRKFIKSLIYQIDYASYKIRLLESITRKSSIHQRRDIFEQSLKLGIKVIGKIVKELFPTNFMISNENGKFLDRTKIQLEKAKIAETNTHHEINNTLAKIMELEKLINSTDAKLKKIEVATMLMMTAEQINKLTSAIEWLGNGITNMLYTHRIPINLINDETLKAELDKLAKGEIKNGLMPLTDNPYELKAAVGYDDKTHTIFMILKIPFKDAEPTYRTQILNKYIVANINGIPRIMEILSNRVYYQKSLENKMYFTANMDEESKRPKIWTTTKPKCINAFEDTNTSLIFKNCRLKTKEDLIKFETISEKIICVHITTPEIAKLICDDEVRLISIPAGTSAIELNKECILETKLETIHHRHETGTQKKPLKITLKLTNNTETEQPIESPLPTAEVIRSYVAIFLGGISATLLTILYARLGFQKIRALYNARKA